MSALPTVHVVAVGDELRSGRRQDTNGPWMARRLSAVGLIPTQLHLAGDDPNDLAALLKHLAIDADLLLLCGGLGPTSDDTTRQALAMAMDRPLREDATAWHQIQARLVAMNRVPNELQRTQALIPSDAHPLENPVGTAPGIRARLGHATLMALPGVPIEMQAMFDRFVAPFAAEHFGQLAPRRTTVWVACVPESDVARQMAALPAAKGVALAYYAHHGEIEVVAQASHERALVDFERAARKALGVAVFDPPPGGRIEHATVQALAAGNATVAVAESLTGGGISHMLTSVPGASDVLAFGWVTYSSAAKTASLGVPPDLIEREGVVSAAVAEAMARGARERSGATFGLATTGVAGPGDFQDGARLVPAGRAHIALATPGATQGLQIDGGRPRALVRRTVSVSALDLLRRALLPRGLHHS